MGLGWGKYAVTVSTGFEGQLIVVRNKLYTCTEEDFSALTDRRSHRV